MNTDSTNSDARARGRLVDLLHFRWNVPLLSAFDGLGGKAKFVTLERRLGISRSTLQRTLGGVIDLGLVARNPGYGHPLRPEYVLTELGRHVAPACASLEKALEHLGVTEVALNKWSLPTLDALMREPARFNRLRDALGEVTPRALALALHDLERSGLVRRTLIDERPPRAEYEPTRAGRRIARSADALAQSL
jgi:DNA-binding HxlR family transcriptional regulator